MFLAVGGWDDKVGFRTLFEGGILLMGSPEGVYFGQPELVSSNDARNNEQSVSHRCKTTGTYKNVTLTVVFRRSGGNHQDG